MTDEEIIQALECISTFDCEICIDDKCTYYTGGEMYPCNDMKIAKDTLDLINRQKTEIERLQKENHQFACMGKFYSEIKSDVAKEFADRVKDDIDNLVNEMLPEPSKVEHDSLCETETYKG